MDKYTQGEAHVMMEAEIRVMPPQAEECSKPHQLREGHGTGPAFSCEEDLTLPTSSFDTSNLQNWERIHFYCSKPQSLWYFVMAALGD